MSRGSRMRRVNELLREVIAEEVQTLKDPGLGFLTITGVDTAPDLRSARVYYSVLGTDEEREATDGALERAAPRIRSAVGRQVRLKYLPELRFELDAGIDQGLRIEALLRELEEEERVREMISEPLKRAAERIAAADEVAVSCHVSPDGDALGSSIALARAAAQQGKKTVVSFGSPYVVPDTFNFMDLSLLVPPSDFPEAPEVMVVFDVASPDRIGELAANADRAGTLIVIDHHRTNSGFGDIQVIDPEAGASGQLAFYLLRELGWEIDEATATALLTALVTDTGRFQYSATDGDIMRVAAELLDTGVRPEVIGQNVYESVPFGYLSVSSAVLGRAQLDQDLSLVWSVLYRDDLDRAGIGVEQADALIDDLRVAREADAAALVKQVPGGFKVSLRSRGENDVGAVAQANGGGGHRNAAGFTVLGESLEQVIERVRSTLRG